MPRRAPACWIRPALAAVLLVAGCFAAAPSAFAQETKEEAPAAAREATRETVGGATIERRSLSEGTQVRSPENIGSGARGQTPADSEGLRMRPEGIPGGRPGAGAPPGRSGRPGQGGGMNQFRIAADADALMLRLVPEGDAFRQDLDVIEGDEFTTDVLVSNPAGRSFDRVRLVIDYNPTVLAPIAVNDSAISHLVVGTPVTRVDRMLGQVIYEAQLARPVADFSGPIVFVRWRAIGPVFYAPIRFGTSRDGFFSAVLNQGQSVLGSANDPTDGTVSMGVRVIPADPEEAALMQEEPNLFRGTTDRVGGVRLSVLPPERTPRVGERFTLDIHLDNSVHSMMDGVSIILEYDPRVMHVLDSDHDNWITLGHNISDGPFREDFPFDYHLANRVLPTRGLIEYRVSATMPDAFLGRSGTIARIHAVALEPTNDARVDFLFARRRGERTTQVVFLGQNALGDPSIRNDGVQGARFRILPPDPRAQQSASR